MEDMKLQKYMAHCQVASRRECEGIIQSKRVTVNGVVAHLGMRVSEDDAVMLDDKPLVYIQKPFVYIILNKPVGVVTTAKDTHGRQTVMDIVSPRQRVYPVGRLDMDSSGLLLLTNDGELANRLTHPKYGVVKTYIARLRGRVSDTSLNHLRDGVELNGRMTHPAQIELLGRTNAFTRIKISIHEGRNRQIRRMCLAIDHPVLSLIRSEYAGLTLSGLPPGQWRELTEDEKQRVASKKPF